MSKEKPMSPWVSFGTAGAGGLLGWICVHPFNTLSIRMNLAGANPEVAAPKSFLKFSASVIRNEGVLNLYNGLSAGLLRQLFYATARFGFFEVFRDELAKYRETDFVSRLVCGVSSGGLAAVISCPCEVTLVRMSNDASLPVDKRRNYKGVVDAFRRIMSEEGAAAFFRGCGPFVNRALLVGAVQVGTYDQFKNMYKKMVGHEMLSVFYASMTSGLIYSIVTMPFETAKNRMAFQRPDPVTGVRPYTGAIQTMKSIIAKEGLFRLWAGFPPYYLRCGGHTVTMFLSVEWLRNMYRNI